MSRTDLEPAPPAAPTSAPQTPTVERTLTTSGLVGLLLGGTLSTYTFGSMNDALPVIGRELGASGGTLSLLLGGFACGFAAVLIIAGRLGDRYGRRLLFRIGIAAFAVTSVAAGFATGIEQLVVLRVLQGVAAGVFMPQVLSTIQATTTGAARIRAVSAYAAVLGFGTGIGQVLAGALIGLDLGGTSWRPVLWFGAVLAGGVLIITERVPQTRSDQPAAADLPGTVMMAGFLAALVFALSMGPSLGWPVWSVIMILGAVLLAVIFYRHELRAESRGRIPLAPPSILRIPVLRVGLIMALIFFVGYGGLMNVCALMTQAGPQDGGLGQSAMMSGITVLPFVVAYVIASMLVGRIVRRVGDRIMIIGGVLQGIGLVTMAGVALYLGSGGQLGNPGAGPDPVITALAIQLPFMITGAAQAIMFGPMMQTVMSQVPLTAAGLSGGLVNTVQQTGFGLGVAVVGSAYHWIAQGHGAVVGFAGGALVDAAAAVIFVVLALRLRRRALATT